MPSAQSLVGVLWSAVATIDCVAPRLAAGELQPFEGLRARHLVHQMAVDVEQRRAVRFFADDVAVPNLS